jgi:hypothetical protein
MRGLLLMALDASLWLYLPNTEGKKVSVLAPESKRYSSWRCDQAGSIEQGELRTWAAIVALSLPMSGCFAYPKKIEYYDSDCNIEAKKWVLLAESVNMGCQDTASCAAVLGVSAGSAIVSGSIVVAGNTVYWLEKQGRCVPKSPSLVE